MKFLIIVLLIHFVAELIGNRKEANKVEERREDEVIHPAEYQMRW